MSSSEYGSADAADILHGLNVITGDQLSQFLTFPEEEEDLNIFRSHQFVDYDTGVSADFTFVPPKSDAPGPTSSTTAESPIAFDPSLYASE